MNSFCQKKKNPQFIDSKHKFVRLDSKQKTFWGNRVTVLKKKAQVCQIFIKNCLQRIFFLKYYKNYCRATIILFLFTRFFIILLSSNNEIKIKITVSEIYYIINTIVVK